MILLISASQVARIIGFSNWCTAFLFFKRQKERGEEQRGREKKGDINLSQKLAQNNTLI
jgi:hypothetical protein